MSRKFAFQQLIEDTRETYISARPVSDCPSSDALIEYAYEGLADDEAERIREHLATCEACRLLELRVRADERLWQEMLEHDSEAALSRALGESGRQEVGEMIRREAREKGIAQAAAFVSTIQEKMISWVSPLWQPMYAGEPVTANVLEEQQTNFEMNYGEYINLSCHWHEEKDRQACIELAWQANLLQPSRLWARFIDPDNSTILTEILLGNELEGRLCIPGERLNFNPTADKWAIAIIVEED